MDISSRKETNERRKERANEAREALPREKAEDLRNSALWEAAIFRLNFCVIRYS
jgi:hypothetical protein